jgi:hypothetical protein
MICSGGAPRGARFRMGELLRPMYATLMKGIKVLRPSSAPILLLFPDRRSLVADGVLKGARN